MPSVEANRDRWNDHRWTQRGDEWSPGRCAEGTRLLWHRTVLPRIVPAVPTGTILEIAPGFGRWTQFLRDLCQRLIVVDLSTRCIEECAARFAGDDRIEYHVNDGQSLDMIADGSIDFVFSFDSLVHAEADAVGAYLRQAARKLRPGGSGFIHHSNLGAFRDRRSGAIPRFVAPRNWRAESVSAQTVRRQCTDAGMHCRSQELINWIGGGVHADRHRLDGRLMPLTDCLSVFVNEPSSAPTRIVLNRAFVDEWRASVWMVGFYAKASPPVEPSTIAEASGGWQTKIRTARAVWRQSAAQGVAAMVRDRIGERVAFWWSGVVARLRGEVMRLLSRRRIA